MSANNKIVPLFPDEPYASDLDKYNKLSPETGTAGIGTQMTLEEIQEQAQINHVSITLCNILATAIEQCGYEHPTLEIETNKDFCLVIEAIISLIRRYNDTPHPLQALADECIVMNQWENDGYSYEFRNVITEDDEETEF